MSVTNAIPASSPSARWCRSRPARRAAGAGRAHQVGGGRGDRAHLHQHVRRLRGDAAHAGDVPQIGARQVSDSLTTIAYLGAAILFILSLGGLSNPETSRRGNLYGIIGMTIAVLATVLGPRVSRGRRALDRRRNGRGRCAGPVRRAHRADDADAGAGRADAQPGGPRGLPGRVRKLHRHLRRFPARRRRSTKWRSTSAS
jgi:hypothetical protein